MKFALNMDRTGQHILSNEFCYFDGKVKWCKGFVSLSASMYHQMLRKLIPLASMECTGKNTTTVALFWTLLNDVLKEENSLSPWLDNRHGWGQRSGSKNGLWNTCSWLNKNMRVLRLKFANTEDEGNFRWTIGFPGIDTEELLVEIPHSVKEVSHFIVCVSFATVVRYGKSNSFLSLFSLKAPRNMLAYSAQKSASLKHDIQSIVSFPTNMIHVMSKVVKSRYYWYF